MHVCVWCVCGVRVCGVCVRVYVCVCVWCVSWCVCCDLHVIYRRPNEAGARQDILLGTVNVYCPECPPGGTIGHPGGQQKKFLPFGHGRDLVAFNDTGL